MFKYRLGIPFRVYLFLIHGNTIRNQNKTIDSKNKKKNELDNKNTRLKLIQSSNASVLKAPEADRKSPLKADTKIKCRYENTGNCKTKHCKNFHPIRPSLNCLIHFYKRQSASDWADEYGFLPLKYILNLITSCDFWSMIRKI